MAFLFNCGPINYSVSFQIKQNLLNLIETCLMLSNVIYLTELFITQGNKHAGQVTRE